MHVPRWMQEKCECGFCNTYNEPSEIQIIEHPEGFEGKAVAVQYACLNENCKFLKMDMGKSTYTILYMRHANAYLKYLQTENGKGHKGLYVETEKEYCNESTF